ncbi:MAG: hypothetical protein AAB466_05995, partial [Verrucomicrobiota bacterium]
VHSLPCREREIPFQMKISCATKTERTEKIVKAMTQNLIHSRPQIIHRAAERLADERGSPQRQQAGFG